MIQTKEEIKAVFHVSLCFRSMQYFNSASGHWYNPVFVHQASALPVNNIKIIAIAASNA